MGSSLPVVPVVRAVKGESPPGAGSHDGANCGKSRPRGSSTPARLT